MKTTTLFKIALLPLLISTALSVQAWDLYVDDIEDQVLSPFYGNGRINRQQIVSGTAKNTTILSSTINDKTEGFYQTIKGGKAFNTTIYGNSAHIVKNQGSSEDVVLYNKSRLYLDSGTVKNVLLQDESKLDISLLQLDYEGFPDQTSYVSNIKLQGQSKLEIRAPLENQNGFISNVEVGGQASAEVIGNVDLDNFKISGWFYDRESINYIYPNQSVAPKMKNFTFKNGGSGVINVGTIINPIIENGANLQIKGGKLIGADVDGFIEVSNDDSSESQAIEGDFVVRKDGKFLLNKNSNAKFNSASFDVAGNLRFAKNAEFDNLFLHDGSVFFENENFLKLNVKNLSGYGNFYMNSAISDHESDFIKAENSWGRFGILMRDSGRTPDAEYDLKIAHIKGSASFYLLNELVDLGVYKYALTHAGDDWYLTPTQWLSTGSTAIISSIDGNNKYAINSVERVQSRLMIDANDRDNNLGENSRLWLDYDNSRLNHSRNESNYWLLNNAVTMGFDKAFLFESGTNVLGGYVGYGHSTQRFKNVNGKNDINYATVGIYDNYRTGKYWLSGVFQFNHVKNSIIFNTQTAESKARFDSNYYTASIHTGFDFTVSNLIATPYTALILNYGTPDSFISTNDLKADPDTQLNTAAKIGIFNNLNYSFDKLVLNPFIDTYVSSDLNKKNNVKFNNKDVDINNGDVSFNADVGVKATYENVSGFIKSGYSRGSYTEKPYIVTVGFDYKF